MVWYRLRVAIIGEVLRSAQNANTKRAVKTIPSTVV
jgi:hypothetical protein